MPGAPYRFIVVDSPRPGVRRVTLNRPEKRNALSNELRGELFDALRRADGDDAVRVSIVRGAGVCFSAGYDLGADLTQGRPYPTAGGDGHWPRHVVDGWFQIWDLAKPVIAQVHGYCLAGGSELAAACDLVYVAEDAQIGYPPVRLMSPPDTQFHPWLAGMRHAMELMLTGDPVSGAEAARIGLANRAYPAARLEGRVLEIAERVAKIPTSLQQINKRSVHRAMEIMGMRAAIRAGTELQALAFHQPESVAYRKEVRANLKRALDQRDGRFGDYRAARHGARRTARRTTAGAAKRSTNGRKEKGS
ncbi:MAG TPA: enoyl-CoA hydratase-related protein [Pseudomonadales bacterium]|nr:enoyl-CoA hydratase-related protein [Pseudomonadales bacterium]